MTASSAVGRIDPRRLTDQIDFGPRSIDRPALALTAATTPDVDAYLNGLAPARPAYDDLRRALAQYREFAAAGGWPTVPDGPLLRPGDASDRASALRARLEVTGDWTADAAAGGDRDAPVHDEAGNIAPLMAAIEAALTGRIDFGIVCVDDGSGDPGAEEFAWARRRHARLRVFRQHAQYGRSTALRTSRSASWPMPPW